MQLLFNIILRAFKRNFSNCKTRFSPPPISPNIAAARGVENHDSVVTLFHILIVRIFYLATLFSPKSICRTESLDLSPTVPRISTYWWYCCGDWP